MDTPLIESTENPFVPPSFHLTFAKVFSFLGLSQDGPLFLPHVMFWVRMTCYITLLDTFSSSPWTTKIMFIAIYASWLGCHLTTCLSMRHRFFQRAVVHLTPKRHIALFLGCFFIALLYSVFVLCDWVFGWTSPSTKDLFHHPWSIGVFSVLVLTELYCSFAFIACLALQATILLLLGDCRQQLIENLDLASQNPVTVLESTIDLFAVHTSVSKWWIVALWPALVGMAVAIVLTASLALQGEPDMYSYLSVVSLLSIALLTLPAYTASHWGTLCSKVGHYSSTRALSGIATDESVLRALDSLVARVQASGFPHLGRGFGYAVLLRGVYVLVLAISFVRSASIHL